MGLSIRKRLYLLFGFQLVGFIGLLCLLYAYIIPSVKRLEKEKRLSTKLIKDISSVQLLINSYFDHNMGFHSLEKSIDSLIKEGLKDKKEVRDRFTEAYTDYWKYDCRICFPYGVIFKLFFIVSEQ